MLKKYFRSDQFPRPLFTDEKTAPERKHVFRKLTSDL